MPASAAWRLVRRLVPYPLRLELVRLRRLPEYLLESRGFARQRRALDTGAWRFVLAAHDSPLRRDGQQLPGAAALDLSRLQRGKERNVALAAGRLDGTVIEPGEVLSYHWLVGRPSRLRGFRAGLELHDGRPSAGVGGGCCLLSNLLFVLALRGGMRIVERHRHALDLFPDRERSVPFGCGATVAYNYADLRFQNPLPGPVLLRLAIADGRLRGRLLAPADPGFRVEIVELDHRFTRHPEGWTRENRLVRRLLRPDGSLLVAEQVARNVARCLYEPPEDPSCGAPR